MSKPNGPPPSQSNAGTMLALDVGTAKVGIASLKEGIIMPLETIPRAGGNAEREILKLLEKESVSTMIVGLPLDESGQETSECELIRNFCRRLKKRARISILYIDEYGTSLEAKRRLEELPSSAQGSKDIDAVAASLILQAYLDGEQVVSEQS